jgi:AraC-like DNA-binding protein
MRPLTFKLPVDMTAQSVDEVAAWAKKAYGPMSVEKISKDPLFSFEHQSLPLGDIEINQLRVHSRQVEVHAQEQDHYYFAVGNAKCLEIRQGSKKHVLTPGGLFPLNCDVKFDLRFLESPVVGVLKVPKGRFDRFFQETVPGWTGNEPLRFDSSVYAVDHPSSQLVLSYLRALLNATRTQPCLLQRPIFQEFWEQQLMLLLWGALKNSHQALIDGRDGACPPWVIRRAEDYIRSHLFEEFTLEDLVKDQRVGRSTLLQAFKNHKGCGPITFTNALRLEAARKLLLKPSFDDLTVAEIAYRVGYRDPGYFARRYRGKFKETPSGTRKNR